MGEDRLFFFISDLKAFLAHLGRYFWMMEYLGFSSFLTEIIPILAAVLASHPIFLDNLQEMYATFMLCIRRVVFLCCTYPDSFWKSLSARIHPISCRNSTSTSSETMISMGITTFFVLDDTIIHYFVWIRKRSIEFFCILYYDDVKIYG